MNDRLQVAGQLAARQQHMVEPQALVKRVRQLVKKLNRLYAKKPKLGVIQAWQNVAPLRQVVVRQMRTRKKLNLFQRAVRPAKLPKWQPQVLVQRPKLNRVQPLKKRKVLRQHNQRV